MKYMIITADDYGISEAVNQGIEEGIAAGFLTSTNLMTNMPFREQAGHSEPFSPRSRSACTGTRLAAIPSPRPRASPRWWSRTAASTHTPAFALCTGQEKSAPMRYGQSSPPRAGNLSGSRARRPIIGIRTRTCMWISAFIFCLPGSPQMSQKTAWESRSWPCGATKGSMSTPRERILPCR